MVAGKYATRILPSDGRTGFYLCPREFAVVAAAYTALGHQIVDAAAPVFIAGIPVLHGAILHLGALFHNDFHNGGVKLVFVALRGSASFQIRHITIIVSHNERSLELPGLGGIDAEIRRQFHRAAHALGNVDE